MHEHLLIERLAECERIQREFIATLKLKQQQDRIEENQKIICGLLKRLLEESHGITAAEFAEFVSHLKRIIGDLQEIK